MVNLSTDVNSFEDLFPGIRIRFLAASFVFYIPAYRDLALGGGVCDASRYNAQHLLDQGYSLGLVPGGATEALYADPSADVFYLRSRLGFMRLAMQSGALLVPVISFNENNTYHQVNSEWGLVDKAKRKWQAIFGLSMPLITNVIPHRAPIATVVGSPMEVPHHPSPSDDEVRTQLERYIEFVAELYNAHKDKYNTPGKAPLRIV